MALFYLNIRHGEALARIPNTVQFRSADEARDNAIVSMRALLAMGPSDGDFHSQPIAVADAGTNHPVAVVSFCDVAPALDLHVEETCKSAPKA